MKHGLLIAACAGVSVALSGAPAQLPQTQVKNWPQFRGPSANGVMDGANTPTKWNIASNENVAWKTAIPGLSHGCPVVWGDHVIVTTAISGQADAKLKVGLYGDIAPVEDDSVHEWKLYSLNRKTGKIEWERTLLKSVPKVKRHTKATHSNTTAATDGRHIVVFLGSEGLFCYDMAGKELWKRDFGTLDSGYYLIPNAQWGFASSPVIHGNKVILQADVQKGSFLTALNVADGSTIWKTDRGEVPTWGTPAISTEDGRSQVIVNGWKHMGGYDLLTGKEIWKLSGGGDIPVPTPIISNGMAIITNGHGRSNPVYAINLSAKGDITPPNEEGASASKYVAWWTRRDGAYMQTPIVYGDYLYVCKDNGVLSCFQVITGKLIYQERMGTGRTGFTASAVAADGKLYFTGEYGEIMVVKAGPKFEILAQNAMDEVCMATPAITPGMLVFRTQGHVVAVGKPSN